MSTARLFRVYVGLIRPITPSGKDFMLEAIDVLKGVSTVSN